MANPVFDTGVFLIMLITALYILTTSNKIGVVFLLIATSLFVILGLVLITGNDVVFYTTTFDGVTLYNQTSYFIHNTQSGQSIQWLGYIFLALSIVSGMKFLIGVTDKSQKLL